MSARRKAGSGARRARRETYEKLGTFYLGKTYDLKAGHVQDELFLYDAKDLVTHAVCVGMTGSGKTGLGIGVLEEAAIDGIPALIVDPKGDLVNLLLTFPELRGEDFLPWVNADEASRKGISPEAFAEEQAKRWAEGLQAWGQEGGRIARLREAAEFVVYTPGSRSGMPLAMLRSLSAPPASLRDDPDLYTERIRATVSGLLGLLGVTADPVQSREHVLLANLLDWAWTRGEEINLARLVGLVQTPPFDKLGVLDLETSYPAAQRSDLVTALNNLVAAPGFDVWTEGEPLEIERLLWTEGGKPRHSIVSIAHLSESERMFVVTMLLNEVLAWIRTQPGTGSLRAILFMDEILGFFPPVAEPPSKAPMLTLLKQARAYGLGIFLTSQNPADLDYKGLANAGTWFVGRLQTERDKQRLLDGLEGVAARKEGGWTRKWLDQAISGLEKRVFLVNNVHEDGPSVLQTRWTLSYLRGPVTREQIQSLMGSDRKGEPSRPAASRPEPTAERAADEMGPAPALPESVPQVYLPSRAKDGRVVYRPMLLGVARMRFADRTLKIDTTADEVFLTAIKDAPIPVDWAEARPIQLNPNDLAQQGLPAANYEVLPPPGARAANYAGWKKDFTAWLASGYSLDLWRSPATGVVSDPGETEASFGARVGLAHRERRDEAVEKLRRKYAPKLTRLQDRLRRAEQAVERESEQAQAQKTQTAISFGATVLGAFVGRKAVSATTLGRATTAARGVSRSLKESKDIDRAEANAEAVQEQLEAMEAEFEAEVEAIEEALTDDQTLEAISIRPKKTGITVQLVALAWCPHVPGPGGSLEPAWS